MFDFSQQFCIMHSGMHQRCKDGYTQLDIYGAGYSAGNDAIAKTLQSKGSSRTSQNKGRKLLGDFRHEV